MNEEEEDAKLNCKNETENTGKKQQWCENTGKKQPQCENTRKK